MFGAPRSKEFDDVYFSADDGLAESEYVFLDGNHLPREWQGKPRYTICETGFGTGLNFLAAWKRFDETSEAGQALDFISFEKFPLDAEEINLHLQPWADVFEAYLPKLVGAYPPLMSGYHRIVLAGNVTLTLVFGDVNEELPRIDGSVDAWFLDGFKPSTNPDMWSETVFAEMERLSHEGTRLATFTAAGQVRRGLADVGFEIKKTKGFGRKRDMIIGRYDG